MPVLGSLATYNFSAHLGRVSCFPDSMEIYLAPIWTSSCHEIKDWFYFRWAVNMCAVSYVCLDSKMIKFLPNLLFVLWSSTYVAV